MPNRFLYRGWKSCPWRYNLSVLGEHFVRRQMSLLCDSDGNVDDDSRISAHIVLVSARSMNRGDVGVCQCLGYMGSYISPVQVDSKVLTNIAMMHKTCKEEDGYAVIYGCHSDSYNFSFFHIDEKSRVRLPTTHGRLIHIDKIIGFLDFRDFRHPLLSTWQARLHLSTPNDPPGSTIVTEVVTKGQGRYLPRKQESRVLVGIWE